MSEHRFTVIVSVDDWPEDDLAKGRAEAEYAAAAVNYASLPDARQLDGFADLWRVQADIVSVGSRFETGTPHQVRAHGGTDDQDHR